MSNTLTFLGHAALALEIDGHKILVDPFLTDNPQASVSADDVEADFIVLTHGHGDHVGDTVAIAKRTGAKVIANFEIVGWLQNQGLENVHPQHIGGAFDHPFGNLKLTIAFHGSGLPDGSYGGMPGGLRFATSSGKKLYIAGDTALFSDMKLIGEEGIDVAVLPIGDNFTMGPDDALRAVTFIEPGLAIPVHYDTWPLIEADAEAWCGRVKETTESDARVLAPGATLEW